MMVDGATRHLFAEHILFVRRARRRTHIGYVTMPYTLGHSEGGTPGLDSTSSLSLLAQEVLDLLNQRR